MALKVLQRREWRSYLPFSSIYLISFLPVMIVTRNTSFSVCLCLIIVMKEQLPTICVSSAALSWMNICKRSPHLFQLCRGQRSPLNVAEFFDDTFDRTVLEVSGVVLTGLLSILQGVGWHLQVLLKLERNNEYSLIYLVLYYVTVDAGWLGGWMERFKMHR